MAFPAFSARFHSSSNSSVVRSKRSWPTATSRDAAFSTNFPAHNSLDASAARAEVVGLRREPAEAVVGAAHPALALRGVAYRPAGATTLLRRNMLVYGLGGLVVPFLGIKLVDLVVSGLLGA